MPDDVHGTSLEPWIAVGFECFVKGARRASDHRGRIHRLSAAEHRQGRTSGGWLTGRGCSLGRDHRAGVRDPREARRLSGAERVGRSLPARILGRRATSKPNRQDGKLLDAPAASSGPRPVVSSNPAFPAPDGAPSISRRFQSPLMAFRSAALRLPWSRTSTPMRSKDQHPTGGVQGTEQLDRCPWIAAGPSRTAPLTARNGPVIRRRGPSPGTARRLKSGVAREATQAAREIVALKLPTPIVVHPANRVRRARQSGHDNKLFSSPEVPEEVLIDDTRRAAFSILSLAFKEDNKWRLHDGNSAISALILDERFIRRVNNNQIAFAKGDVLICDVRMTQTRDRNGLRTEYVVEHVAEHKPAAQQVAMFLEVGPTS